MTKDRKFDRIAQNDFRSLMQYNVDDRLEAEQRQPRSYTWACDKNLDQGSEGACVAFAWTHERAARPKVGPVDNALARSLYPLMQRVDEWPGEEPTYSGTSVLAGAKIAKEKGWIGEYWWADNVTDALAAISFRGPAVLGVDWYEGMLDTDADGFIHATGRIVGGHSILARGVSLSKQAVLLHNSWGKDWGGTEKGPGTAWLSFYDFNYLIQNHGDVCIPLERR